MARIAHAGGKLRRKRARSTASIYLRRAPFLISYWSDKQLIIENYLTRKKVAASVEIASLLDFFSDWRQVNELLTQRREYSSISLVRAVNRLLQETLLEGARRKNPPEGKREKALRNWRAWNPAAGFYHLSTKDIYADEVTPEEIAFVEQLAKTRPVPKPLKAYPGTAVIRLERGTVSGEFPRVLKERRTWREFSGRKVSKDALSKLLNLSFGIQAWEDVPTIGRLAQ
jgi:hypothetical protein